MHLKWICWWALLLLGGAGAVLGQGNKKAPRAVPVVVSPVRVVSESPTFKASGLLSPVDKALLSADVPGRVVVSEYVDVANAFVDREETGMVNAVLDQIGRQFRGDEFGRG